MANCITLEDINTAACPLEAANRGGVSPTIIFGYWDDVATWPTYPKAASGALTMENAGKLEGKLAMQQGTKAYKIEGIEYSGTFTITEQGEMGGYSVKQELTIGGGKIAAKILGFMNATRGRKMFFIVQDKNGFWHLMGDAVVAAYRTAGDAATTGANATELNTVPLHFEHDALFACIYEDENIYKLLEPAPGD